MSKLLTYTFILVGINILLAFYGIQNGTSAVLDYFNLIENPEGISSNNLYTLLVTLFTISAGAAIIVGFFGTNISESLLIGGVTYVFLQFIVDFGSVMTYINGAYPGSPVQYIVGAIFTALLFGYIIALISFWRGSD